MTCILLLTMLILLVQILQAAVMTMLSKGHSFVLNTGQSVDAPCEFYSDEFSMFENPVIWKKHQSDEETPVNIMGNILDPFLATGRFEVALVNDHPRYQMTLKIERLLLEDSGNYTCEIRGRRSAVLATIAHSISVRAPILHVSLEIDNSTMVLPPIEDSLTDSQGFLLNNGPASTDISARPVLLKRVTFIEGMPRTIRCVAYGGYPLPEMVIYLGDVDITPRFSLAYSVTLDGVKGLRIIRYRTERRSDIVTISSRDDEQPIRCAVSVPGLGTILSIVNTHVIYRPVIACPATSAYVGDRNMALRCEVRARPPLTALFWILDINGTTVSEGQVVNEYWTLNMDRSDGIMETKLFMKQVLRQSFRSYTVVAENAIAASTKQVELTQKFRPSTTSTDLVLADRPRNVLEQNDGRHNPRYVSMTSRSLAAIDIRRTSRLPYTLTLLVAVWRYSSPPADLHWPT